jgi:hypothetical protein
MGNDSVTKTTSQSWFSRLGGAIAGVLVGVFLFFAAFPLLTWNEGRAIKRIKTLQVGRGETVSVPAAPIDAANDGRLVHVTGDLVATEAVSDEQFGLTAPVIKLRRNVEMYQWSEDEKSETRKKLGGGEETVTTYTYAKSWSSGAVNSDSFHTSQGHENPKEWPVRAETFVADPITVGAFTLPESLVSRIDNFQPQAVSAKDKAAISHDFGIPVAVAGEGFYLGVNPREPAIGDVKVSFEVVKPGSVSILARQIQTTFEPYAVKGLGSIELLEAGTVSAENMFAAAEQENTIITWLLRLAGFVMMFVGLVLIANPLSVLADVIPFIGNIVGAGAGLVAFFLAAGLSFVTIALAWLAFRPLIGAPLLIAALACGYFGVRAMGRRKATPAAVA